MTNRTLRMGRGSDPIPGSPVCAGNETNQIQAAGPGTGVGDASPFPTAGPTGRVTNCGWK